MAINDWGSPKLSAIKMLFDELYPLVVCNQIAVNIDNQVFDIYVVCVDPVREVFIKLSDDGKVVVVYKSGTFRKDISFELVDPKCSLKLLHFILEQDEFILKETMVKWNKVIDRWGDLRFRVGSLVG